MEFLLRHLGHNKSLWAVPCSLYGSSHERRAMSIRLVVITLIAVIGLFSVGYAQRSNAVTSDPVDTAIWADTAKTLQGWDTTALKAKTAPRTAVSSDHLDWSLAGEVDLPSTFIIGGNSSSLGPYGSFSFDSLPKWKVNCWPGPDYGVFAITAIPFDFRKANRGAGAYRQDSSFVDKATRSDYLFFPSLAQYLSGDSVALVSRANTFLLLQTFGLATVDSLHVKKICTAPLAIAPNQYANYPYAWQTAGYGFENYYTASNSYWLIWKPDFYEWMINYSTLTLDSLQLRCLGTNTRDSLLLEIVLVDARGTGYSYASSGFWGVPTTNGTITFPVNRKLGAYVDTTVEYGLQSMLVPNDTIWTITARYFYTLTY